jgi:hypothetical protein
MGSAAFKAARHEETLEAAAAVIAGIDKALVSHGTDRAHPQSTSWPLSSTRLSPVLWPLIGQIGVFVNSSIFRGRESMILAENHV